MHCTFNNLPKKHRTFVIQLPSVTTCQATKYTDIRLFKYCNESGYIANHQEGKILAKNIKNLLASVTQCIVTITISTSANHNHYDSSTSTD